MSVKSSISLPEAQDAFIRDLVKRGKFTSVSAAIQKGVEMLQDEITSEEEFEAGLKIVIEERLKGPFISAEEFSERVDEMLERKRKERGL